MEQDNELDKDFKVTEVQESSVEDSESSAEKAQIQADEVADLSDNIDENMQVSAESADTELMQDDIIDQDNIGQEVADTIDEPEDLAEKINSVDINNQQEDPEEMITVRPVKFQEFEMTEPNRSIKKNLDILQDINMHISVELGRANFTIKEVMDLEKGSIVELDKVAGEQVEIYVNNKMVAKGEVIVIEDKFGVRVTNTNIGKKI